MKIDLSFQEPEEQEAQYHPLWLFSSSGLSISFHRLQRRLVCLSMPQQRNASTAMPAIVPHCHNVWLVNTGLLSSIWHCWSTPKQSFHCRSAKSFKSSQVATLSDQCFWAYSQLFSETSLPQISIESDFNWIRHLPITDTLTFHSLGIHPRSWETFLFKPLKFPLLGKITSLPPRRAQI